MVAFVEMVVKAKIFISDQHDILVAILELLRSPPPSSVEQTAGERSVVADSLEEAQHVLAGGDDATSDMIGRAISLLRQPAAAVGEATATPYGEVQGKYDHNFEGCWSEPNTSTTPAGVSAAELEARLTAVTLWLEREQPDVFRRGLWDAVAAARLAPPSAPSAVDAGE
jgi:hypothetical protein